MRFTKTFYTASQLFRNWDGASIFNAGVTDTLHMILNIHNIHKNVAWTDLEYKTKFPSHVKACIKKICAGGRLMCNMT